MSSPFETESRLRVHELNGVEWKVGHEYERLRVCEHWNRRELIKLAFGGMIISVDAGDLIRAIQNAKNAHKF